MQPKLRRLVFMLLTIFVLPQISQYLKDKCDLADRVNGRLLVAEVAAESASDRSCAAFFLACTSSLFGGSGTWSATCALELEPPTVAGCAASGESGLLGDFSRRGRFGDPCVDSGKWAPRSAGSLCGPPSARSQGSLRSAHLNVIAL